MTSQELAQISRLKKGNQANNTIREQFAPGKTYTLIRIFAKGDKVIYKFGDGGGGIVEAEFTTVKHGESFIAEVRGEEIPDYTEVYINKTD
jgi:hypothetical protein